MLRSLTIVYTIEDETSFAEQRQLFAEQFMLDAASTNTTTKSNRLTGMSNSDELHKNSLISDITQSEEDLYEKLQLIELVLEHKDINSVNSIDDL